jgi:hypothetical protein
LIPEGARNMKLHVEWHKIREKVLELAKNRAGGRGDVHELLSTINNDCDEGLTL